jgi:hypothetical protein
MALIREQLQPRPAPHLRLGRQPIEPFQEWGDSIIISKEDNRHRWRQDQGSLANLLSSIKEGTRAMSSPGDRKL